MLGVIDVGGGERGIYGAGVFDFFLENGIEFDYLIGVSAGSANEASFLARQEKRNYTYYYDFAFRKEYMSLGHFLKTGNYLDLDWIYGTTANRGGIYPLDYKTMASAGKKFYIVATDAETGTPVYFSAETDVSQDNYNAMKCSSNIPVINRPYPFKDGLYYDGGVSDPVPVKKAFQDGCDHVVLILTRPLNYRRDPKKSRRQARLLRKYPAAAKALAARADVYNAQVDLALKYQAEGKLFILAPDTVGKMKTLTKDKSILQEMYDKGFHDAAKAAEWVRKLQ